MIVIETWALWIVMLVSLLTFISLIALAFFGLGYLLSYFGHSIVIGVQQ